MNCLQSITSWAEVQSFSFGGEQARRKAVLNHTDHKEMQFKIVGCRSQIAKSSGSIFFQSTILILKSKILRSAQGLNYLTFSDGFSFSLFNFCVILLLQDVATIIPEVEGSGEILLRPAMSGTP